MKHLKCFGHCGRAGSSPASGTMTDKEFIEICNNSLTMSEACSKIGIHFNTFSKRAKQLGCYHPNIGGKGMNKKSANGNTISLQEILDGKYPNYQTFKLKNKLFKAGLKENKCEICGISEWLGKPIKCELHHKDGNRNNHRLENLQMLCPNCHSQTDTYKALNIKNKISK